MTRSRSAAVAACLCVVIAACSADDDEVGPGRAQGTSPPTSAASPTTAAAPTTVAPGTSSTTAVPVVGIRITPSTPEEQAAVEAVDRWLELEDQAFSAGTTEAVIDELDTLMKDGSILLQGSLDLGGPVERTSRARIERIWHPDEHVTRMDVCKIVETPAAGEMRTAHTITATAGATPYLESETVFILERDGITCPPDDIIEPVLATYERWMELNTASALDPTADATELYELSGPEVVQAFTQVRANLADTGGHEVFDPPLDGVVVSYAPDSDEATVLDCHLVEDERGTFDAEGDLVGGTRPGVVEHVHAGLRRVAQSWLVISFWIEEDPQWCEPRLS